MTHVGPTPASPAGSLSAAGTSFVEWGAVLAGAVLAAAISFVLLTFGATIGLSATSPWPNSGVSAKVIASIAIFFAMVQQIGAFMAGGYVAGRMRSRWRETSEHEVDFRDGLHGGLVWAVGIVIGAALLLAAAGATARTGLEVGGRTAVFVAASSNDPMDVVLDTLLRRTAVAQAGTPAGQTASRSDARPANDDARAEIARILVSAVAAGSMTEQTRTYVAQLVSQRTGLSQQDAEKRVAEAINQAREAADKARRAALLTGFVTAASLIISFGAAWWAALRGGNHRDNSVPARFEFGTTRRFGAPST
jgi:hypothetical protein